MSKKLSLSISLLICPLLLFAHGSHGDGFMGGFTHPILGIDDNLAIVGVSVLGYEMERSRWYLFPLAFLATMMVDGYIGIGNEATSLIENIIAASVGIVGVLIILQKKKGIPLVLLLLAIFGYFHGYAHGAEMPETNTAMKYIPGFAMGVVVLAFISFALSKVFIKNEEYNTSASVIGGALVGACLMMFLG